MNKVDVFEVRSRRGCLKCRWYAIFTEIVQLATECTASKCDTLVESVVCWSVNFFLTVFLFVLSWVSKLCSAVSVALHFASVYAILQMQITRTTKASWNLLLGISCIELIHQHGN